MLILVNYKLNVHKVKSNYNMGMYNVHHIFKHYRKKIDSKITQ